MPLVIEPQCIRIGDSSDLNLVLGLNPIERMQPQLVQQDNEDFLALPIVPITSGEDYAQRLITILKAALIEQEVDWQRAPVLLLLPEQDSLDDERHQLFFSNLCKAIPALTFHPGCYLFPYGRSAMLLAWRHIESLLYEQQEPYVWVLAVDSDPRLSMPAPGIEQKNNAQRSNGIAAESVIFVKISASEAGLVRHWFSYQTREKDGANNGAIEAIFRRYHQEQATPIHQFYAPYNGNDELVEEWTNAYQLLSPFVGTRTQVVMTGAATGELGVCSGLYNLLHLYTRYQKGDYRYGTLQVEISEKLHRGAASYAWRQ